MTRVFPSAKACGKCKKIKPQKAFSTTSRKWITRNGEFVERRYLKSFCRACEAPYSKKAYQKLKLKKQLL